MKIKSQATPGRFERTIPPATTKINQMIPMIAYGIVQSPAELISEVDITQIGTDLSLGFLVPKQAVTGMRREDLARMLGN